MANNMRTAMPGHIGPARFWDLNDFSDITLYCGNEQYATSKFLLASWSDYFKNRFGLPFREKHENVAKFEDDPEQFDKMMQYLYFGRYDTVQPTKMNGFPGSASYVLAQDRLVNEHLDMYALADKFMFPTLAEYALEHVQKALVCLCRCGEIKHRPEPEQEEEEDIDHARFIVVALGRMLADHSAGGKDLRKMAAEIVLRIGQKNQAQNDDWGTIPNDGWGSARTKDDSVVDDGPPERGFSWDNADGHNSW